MRTEMSISFTRNELTLLDLLVACSEDFVTCQARPDDYAQCRDKINDALHALVTEQANATNRNH